MTPRLAWCGLQHVALLAEGVDRNSQIAIEYYPIYVALLAEGVDRNQPGIDFISFYQLSPSSRRAWIEIAASLVSTPTQKVALLAEGVDRNGLLLPCLR